MYYAGFDLHRSYAVAAVLDSRGGLMSERRLANDEAVIRQFLGDLDGPVEAVLESTWNWPWLYDVLEDAGAAPTLAHPLKVRAIASARLKDDRVDARTLAHLLRADLVPASYVPSAEVRELRELVRARAALVRIQTRLKNRLWALLAKRNLKLTARSLMSHKARLELSELPLSPAARQEMEQSLGLLDHLKDLIVEQNREIRRQAGLSPEARLLMSVPGVGFYTALLIVSEIGEIGRFPSARKLTSYAGLIPTTRSSGGHTYHGRITKQGSSWLRWAVIQATMHAVRRPGPLQRFYRRQERRKGSKIARVAAARKLLIQIYWVLKNQEPYDAMVRRLETAEGSSRFFMA